MRDHYELDDEHIYWHDKYVDTHPAEEVSQHMIPWDFYQITDEYFHLITGKNRKELSKEFMEYLQDLEEKRAERLSPMQYYGISY